MTPCDGAPADAGSNVRPGQPVALGEAGVRAAGAAVGDLDRAEQLLLEPVAAALVELLVGGAERRERAAELVGGDRDRVEEDQAGFAAVVCHRLGG